LPGVEFVGKTLGEVGELTQLGGGHDDHRRNEIAHPRESLANATERIPLTVSPTRPAPRSSRMAMLDRLSELSSTSSEISFAKDSRTVRDACSRRRATPKLFLRRESARESNRNRTRIHAE